MVQKFAPLVKRQVEYWQRQIDQYAPDNPRYRASKAERYKHLVTEFTYLLNHLNKAEGTDLRVESGRRAPAPIRETVLPKPAPAPEQAPEAAASPPDEFSDLPPELLDQLSEGAKAQVDPIIKVINDRGGTATLDQILVDLYRATKEVHKRTIVQNKMFRLSKREMCWSVPGKKGVYTTQKPDESADQPISAEPAAKSEGPPAATDGPSNKNDTGVAGSPGGPIKASAVGSTPTTSTPIARKLMSGTSTAAYYPHHKR